MSDLTIVKFDKPIKVHDFGDILEPFEDWDSTQTGAGWYSKMDEKYCEETDFLPLTSIAYNPWKSLERLGVNATAFKDSVVYECPFTGYKHFWAVPLYLFTKGDVEEWLKTAKSRGAYIPYTDMYKDKGWMRKFNAPVGDRGFNFTRVQRSLLGPGFTSGTLPSDGDGYLYDAFLRLSNDDLLGCKVWIWFNK